jgi:hypothetical protein
MRDMIPGLNKVKGGKRRGGKRAARR